MNSTQFTWLTNTITEATQSNHIYPEMAACEAALESGYGLSTLARRANNLFGMKQHTHPIHGTLSLPTKESIHNEWVTVTADWVEYPTIEDCFEDRMATLERLASVYPDYAAALNATDPVTYVTEVSKKWSTDPNRASKVISIYHSYKAMTLPTPNVDESA